MRILKLSFIIIFFSLISLPLIGLLWYREPAATENKVLAKAPQLTGEKGLNTSFLADTEQWYADHFAYRQELVTANALVRAKVLSESAESLAVVGTEGWSYLAVTLPDYQGTKKLSDRGLYACARALSLMREYTESRGGFFVFASAPNKNTLYPEHMPYYYKRTKDESNLSRLTPLLDSESIPYADLKSLFEADERVLYHKGDSHWDNRGAAMVQHELFLKAGKTHTDFTQLSPTVRDDFVGDIDRILYPQAMHPETEYDYGAYLHFTYTDTEDVTANTVRTENPSKEGSLLCFRDSFGNSLLPFLAEDYQSAYFSKEVPYRMDYIDALGADTVIVELVERNLNHLIAMAPVFPAPLRAVDIDAAERLQDCDTKFAFEKFEGYYKLYGICDPASLSDTGKICISLQSDDASFVVEATPADEYSKLGEGTDYGFVAYIYENSLPAGDYKVEILTETMYTYRYDTGQTITFE